MADIARQIREQEDVIEAAAKALWEHVTTTAGRPTPWTDADDEDAADCRQLVRLVLDTAGWDRYRQHSITLNTVGYTLAEALGETKDGQAEGNPEDQARRLIAELDTYRRDDCHIIDLRLDGWTIQHPLTCRPNLFACPVNQAASRDESLNEHAPGRYRCGLGDDGLIETGEEVTDHG